MPIAKITSVIDKSMSIFVLFSFIRIFIGYYLNEAQSEYCPGFKQKICTPLTLRVCIESDINSYK